MSDVTITNIEANDTVKNKEKPNCLHKVVCYADFEAYIISNGEHEPSGYWCALYGDELIKENLKTVYNFNDAAEQFVNDIFAVPHTPSIPALCQSML